MKSPLDYDTLIASLEATLRELKRALKAEKARLRMLDQRADPKFNAARKAGHKAGWADPEKREKWSQDRAAAGRANRVLPHMNEAQSAIYNKIRREGGSREAAVEQAMR